MTQADPTITYSEMHTALRVLRGRAKDHPCAICQAPAVEWAFNHDSTSEKRTTSWGAVFSLDPLAYDPLCRKCHATRDWEARGGRMAGKRANGKGALRLLPSGKWQAKTWRDGRYVPAPTTFATRDEAEAWLETAA